MVVRREMVSKKKGVGIRNYFYVGILAIIALTIIDVPVDYNDQITGEVHGSFGSNLASSFIGLRARLLGQISCSDECSYRGAKICSGTGIRTCGYFDRDACLDLSPLTSCSNGCTGGVCNTVSCTDSDGRDYSNKGTISFYDPDYGKEITQNDYCLTEIPNGQIDEYSCSGADCRLHEFYCEGNERIGERVLCPNGCSDGACSVGGGGSGGPSTLFIERDIKVTWTENPDDAFVYSGKGKSDWCTIRSKDGGCDAFMAEYLLEGDIQPNVPFYPDYVGSIVVRIEAYASSFTDREFIQGFDSSIVEDYVDKGSKIVESEINYGQYGLVTRRSSGNYDLVVGWPSGNKIIEIFITDIDLSKIDDDVFNNLRNVYLAKYPSDLGLGSSCIDGDEGLDYYIKSTVRGIDADETLHERVIVDGIDEGLEVYSDTSARVSLEGFVRNVIKGEIYDFVVGRIYIENLYFYGLGDSRNMADVRVVDVTDFCDGDDVIEWVCSSTPDGFDNDRYTCPNGCSNGACISLGSSGGGGGSSASCVDSDGGAIYGVKGTVSNVNVGDFRGERTIISNNNDGLEVYSSLSARLKIEGVTRDVTLGGTFDFVKGKIYIDNLAFFGIGDSRNNIEIRIIEVTDFCDGNDVVEVVCDSSVPGNFKDSRYTCPNGCSDGACISTSSGGGGGGSGGPGGSAIVNICTDSDGGSNKKLFGQVNYLINGQTQAPLNDYCSGDGYGVFEYFCEGENPARVWTPLLCNTGEICSNGACVTGFLDSTVTRLSFENYGDVNQISGEAGDRFDLVFMGNPYRFKIEGILTSKVTISVGSSIATMNLGDSRMFDLDKDGSNDVVVLFSSVTTPSGQVKLAHFDVSVLSETNLFL